MTPAGEPRPGALAGIRVADFTHVLAGPFATQILADLGAEVIKIESPSPDAADPFRRVPPSLPGGVDTAAFLSSNRNKKSVALDLKSETGRTAARALIATADVLVENYSRAVMARFGLDFDSLAAEHPSLVYVSVSGWGRTGERADLAGLDPVLSAETGLTYMAGCGVGSTHAPTLPWVDTVTGLNATIAVLAALHARTRSGRGQFVDISMYDSCLVQHSYFGSALLVTGEEPRPYGTHRPATPGSGEYECSDGRTLFVHVMSERMFAGLVRDVLQRPDVLADERFHTLAQRRTHHAELVTILAAELARHPAEHWTQVMAGHIVAGVVRSPSEALSSDFARDRGAVAYVTHPTAGRVATIASPFRWMSETPAVEPTASPLLGEHTDEVLTTLRLNPA